MALQLVFVRMAFTQDLPSSLLQAAAALPLVAALAPVNLWDVVPGMWHSQY